MIYKSYVIRDDGGSSDFEIRIKPCVDGGIIIESEDFLDIGTYRNVWLNKNECDILVDAIKELKR